MFKKLKDKLAEEVKSSPQRIQQFAQAAQVRNYPNVLRIYLLMIREQGMFNNIQKITFPQSLNETIRTTIEKYIWS